MLDQRPTHTVGDDVVTGPSADVSGDGASASGPSSAGTGESSSTGPSLPPGAACGTPQPVGVPPPPEGCEHLWLTGPDGKPIPDAPSGFVVCDGPQWWPPIYRIADVPCPYLLGDECLCDADCPTGTACLCASEVGFKADRRTNMCGVVECRSDEDCGGGRCKVSDLEICTVPISVRCTTPDDDCDGSECFCPYDVTAEKFSCGELGGCE